MPYTCCRNFNLHFLPLCHQLISLITTIICSLNSVWVSYMDSCYTVQQTHFPLNGNLHCISGLWFCRLLVLHWVEEILQTKCWMSSKWKSGERLIYKEAFFSENLNCINSPAWYQWSHKWIMPLVTFKEAVNIYTKHNRQIPGGS